ALLEIVRTVEPGFVLVVKGAFVHRETVRRLRKREGIPIVNYYPDYPYVGVPLTLSKPSAQRSDLVEVLGEYSRVWIWERGLADRLRAGGVPAAYLPFGVDPPNLRTETGECVDCATGHDVVFIGQHSQR